MALGIGLVITAVGAVLVWAVHAHPESWIDVHTVGVILLVLGLVGMLASLVFRSRWAAPGHFTTRRRVVREGVLRDDLRPL